MSRVCVASRTWIPNVSQRIGIDLQHTAGMWPALDFQATSLSNTILQAQGW